MGSDKHETKKKFLRSELLALIEVKMTTILDEGALAMEKVVTAAEASRNFLQLLQQVRRGRSYIVTIHDKQVAKISPVEGAGMLETGARDLLMARLRRQEISHVVSWNRQELYEKPG